MDSDVLLSRLQRDERVDLVSTSDEVIQFAHPDHPVSLRDGRIPSLTNIVRWSKPLELSEFQSALEQTFDWPAAEDAVSRSRYKLLVTDLVGRGLPYRERYELISTVALAVADVTQPDAIHWEPADCIVQPERFKRRLDFYCNVRALTVRNRKGFELMDTLGLAALGLVDAQCLYRGLVSSQMARWTYALARQIFANGDFLKDGETIPGLNPDERWRSRHEQAMVPPVRPVIDITPSAPHAAKR